MSSENRFALFGIMLWRRANNFRVARIVSDEADLLATAIHATGVQIHKSMLAVAEAALNRRRVVRTFFRQIRVERSGDEAHERAPFLGYSDTTTVALH